MRVDREEINANGREPLDPEGEFAEYQRTAFVQDQNLTMRSRRSRGRSPATSRSTISSPNWRIRWACRSQTVEQALWPVPARSRAQFWTQTRRPDNQTSRNTNFAPFLGVSWDPWSNGKTKFAVTARRYYDKIFLNVPLIELEPATTDLLWHA